MKGPQKRLLSAVVVGILGCFGGLSAARSLPVRVTYIANEGFLIARGDQKVLVDALFAGLQHYAAPSTRLRPRIEKGEAPFDGVDLALATHFHPDHFGAREVERFLGGSGGSVFVSTPDAVSKLSVSGERTRAVYPPEGERRELEVAGIELIVLNLHHGRSRPEVQNIGFLVDLGGFRVLHIGDSEITAEEIRPLKLGEEAIDLALLPAWHLVEARWRGLVEQIGARHVAAMHLANEGAPPSWFGSAGSRSERIARIRELYPAAWVPEAEMESRDYPPASD